MATTIDTGARRARTRRAGVPRLRDGSPRPRPEAQPLDEAPLRVRVSMAQIARVVTGLLWVTWAAWGSTQAYEPLASVVETVVAALGLVIIASAFVVRSGDARARLDRFLIIGSVALVVVLPLSAAQSLGYLTDELAFDQAAAASVLHGINPYTVDFTHALQSYGVSTGTMTLHGTFEPYVSYPALSFLLYLPAVAALGAHSYAGWFVNLIAWAVAGAAMWRVVDPRVRPWVPVLVTLPPLLGSVIGGVADSLFIPLEIVALCTWQRFSDRSLGRRWRWAGPISLGLACCVKQQPWLLVPFVLIAVGYEAQLRGASWWRETARYAGLAAVAFLIPNLAFIAWDPHAWVSRLLMPFDGALVPMGVGPASWMQPFSIGGGALSLFTVAAAAMLVAAAAALCARYGTFRRLLPLLPAAALFVSTRSFASYFLFLIPTLIVNATALPAIDNVPRPRWHRPLTAAAIAGAVVALATTSAALAISGPLRVSVSAATATSTQLTVVARVVNGSQQVVSPHFFLAKGAYYEQVLTKVSGPDVLAAGASATYEFTTSELPSTPRAGDHFQLQAGTVAPNTITTSPLATVSG